MRTSTDLDAMNIAEIVGYVCCTLALLYVGNLIGYRRGYMTASLDAINIVMKHKKKE